jgi:alkaline phosphatase D
LLRLFGGYVFEGRGDKTFRSVVRQIKKGTRTDALIMLGDQIYADDLNFVGPDSQVDEFLRRYREAFSQKHLGRLMSRVPTYMTLDDHEIEDNWPHKANPRDLQVKYPAAIHAYSIYQMSHSPLGELNEQGTRLAGVPNHFWYQFSDGCCDFFVLDTRTERRNQTEIISHGQMRELKQWLSSGTERVKVIVSSVPLFPDFIDPSSDKWSGFLGQRDELLNYIHDLKIRRVVTLSGDVHTSMSVQLESEVDPDFQIVSVVSSPFYWPYPHPSPKDFQLEGRLQSNSPYGYRLAEGTTPVSTENFTRLTIDLDKVEVEVFGRKGGKIGDTHRYDFS